MRSNRRALTPMTLIPSPKADAALAGLRAAFRQSVEMERQHNAHDETCSALVQLARSEMHWSIQFAKEGQFERSGFYRRNAWWHLGRARDYRDLASAVRLRRLRVVA